MSGRRCAVILQGSRRLFIALETGQNELGGGARANRVLAGVLAGRFASAPDAEGADLQVHSFNWNPPARPARLFIDQGSFADASFWACTAPRLRTTDTILVSSSVCARVAGRCFGSRSPQVRVVPLPIDTDRFRPRAARRGPRARLLGRYGIPPGVPGDLADSSFVPRQNSHLPV